MSKLLKIIIILVIILLLGLAAIWLYSKFQKPKGITPSTALPTVPSAQKPEEVKSTNQSLTLLSKNKVFKYWIVDSTKEVFYINENGIFKANPDKIIPVLKTEIKNLASADISPSKDKILIGYGQKYSQQFSLYNLIENKILPLPLEITKAVFSYNGKEILALKNNDLIIADLEGKTAKTLVKNFSLKDLNWKWPNSSEIFFYDKPSSLKGGLWRYNLKSRKFEEIFSPQKGLYLRWLNSDSILKLGGEKAGLFSSTGSPLKIFNYYLIPSKCDFSNLNSTSTPYSLYCFYPKYFPKSKKEYWLENYLREGVVTDDNLYLFGGENPKLISSFSQIDAKEAKVFENNIYFINRGNNLLYKFPLKK